MSLTQKDDVGGGAYIMPSTPNTLSFVNLGFLENIHGYIFTECIILKIYYFQNVALSVQKGHWIFDTLIPAKMLRTLSF